MINIKIFWIFLLAVLGLSIPHNLPHYFVLIINNTLLARIWNSYLLNNFDYTSFLISTLSCYGFLSWLQGFTEFVILHECVHTHAHTHAHMHTLPGTSPSYHGIVQVHFLKVKVMDTCWRKILWLLITSWENLLQRNHAIASL